MAQPRLLWRWRQVNWVSVSVSRVTVSKPPRVVGFDRPPFGSWSGLGLGVSLSDHGLSSVLVRDNLRTTWMSPFVFCLSLKRPCTFVYTCMPQVSRFHFVWFNQQLHIQINTITYLIQFSANQQKRRHFIPCPCWHLHYWDGIELSSNPIYA